jgi:hypothetical protein
MNPKFRRIKYDYESETPTKTSTVSSPSITPNHNNGTNDHDLIQHMYEENRKLRFEQDGLFYFHYK